MRTQRDLQLRLSAWVGLFCVQETKLAFGISPVVQAGLRWVGSLLPWGVGSCRTASGRGSGCWQKFPVIGVLYSGGYRSDRRMQRPIQTPQGGRTMILNEGKLHRNTRPIKYEVDDRGCWNVTSHAVRNKDRYSYPVVTRRNKRQDMHRYSYGLHNGRIPHNMVVRHKCDNNMCINPEHLELGTVTDNNHDTMERGRHKPLQESLPPDVIEKCLDRSRSAREIAEECGISIHTVYGRRYHAKRKS